MPGSSTGHDTTTTDRMAQVTSTEARGLVGHLPTGRLVAQRGLFRGPDLVCPPELYTLLERGDALRDRHRLVVQPHSTVSMDSYFGRFPASYWQRWTVVDEVHLELRVIGSGLLSVRA